MAQLPLRRMQNIVACDRNWIDRLAKASGSYAAVLGREVCPLATQRLADWSHFLLLNCPTGPETSTSSAAESQLESQMKLNCSFATCGKATDSNC